MMPPPLCMDVASVRERERERGFLNILQKFYEKKERYRTRGLLRANWRSPWSWFTNYSYESFYVLIHLIFFQLAGNGARHDRKPWRPPYFILRFLNHAWNIYWQERDREVGTPISFFMDRNGKLKIPGHLSPERIFGRNH